MKRRLPWLLPVLLLLFLSWSWYTGTLAVQPRQLDNGAAWRSVACWFEVPAGKRVECGRVMTRDRTNRGRHSLPVVIIRNSWLRNDPSPVVFIQGGPGGAAGLDALTMAWWFADIETWDLGRDFVLYDQRGTGLATPSLRCPEVLSGIRRDLQLALDLNEENERYNGYLRACHARLHESRQRLDDYSTALNSDDLADIINLVEPGSWTLFGASYGTRIALETERRHPQLVRDLLLDSVYPHDRDGFLSWPMVLGRAVDRVLESRGRPDLKPRLATLMKQFSEEPVQLETGDYTSGETIKPVLTGSRLFMMLFAATYSADMVRNIVPVIEELSAGQTGSRMLAGLVSFAIELELDESFSEPVFQSISCREDQIEQMQAYRMQAERFAGDNAVLRDMLVRHTPADACSFWKSGSVPAGFSEPVVTEKPVLLLAGELDAVTPVQWAREMHGYLPASRLLIVPGGGHGVSMTDACTMIIARTFLEEPGAALPLHCKGDGLGPA
mgnify:FL=1